jgi:hypothetical protein
VAEVVALEAHSKASDVLDREAVENLAQEPSLMRPLGMGSDTLAALEMGAFFGSSGFDLADCDLVIEHSRKSGAMNPFASFGSKKRRGASPGSQIISSPLRNADKAPYAFTGTVKKVIFDLKPAARHEDEKALHEAATHGATAHGISA